MNENTIKSRLEEAIADEKFLSKFQGVTTREEIVRLFADEKGIEISDSAAQEFLQGLEEVKNNGELTEAELENAAGGAWGCMLYPIRNVITRIINTHVDFSGSFDFNFFNRNETRNF
jgi:hypothetical protein